MQLFLQSSLQSPLSAAVFPAQQSSHMMVKIVLLWRVCGLSQLSVYTHCQDLDHSADPQDAFTRWYAREVGWQILLGMHIKFLPISISATLIQIGWGFVELFSKLAHFNGPPFPFVSPITFRWIANTSVICYILLDHHVHQCKLPHV